MQDPGSVLTGRATDPGKQTLESRFAPLRQPLFCNLIPTRRECDNGTISWFRFGAIPVRSSRHGAYLPFHPTRWGEEPIFCPYPFQRHRHFLFTRKRNALAFAVLGATATAWDAVKGARNDGPARSRVPIENTCGAEVKTLQVADTILAVDGGKPGKPRSSTARLGQRIHS